MKPSLPLPGMLETGRPPLASYRASLDRAVLAAMEEETQAYIHPNDYEEIIEKLSTTGDLDRAQKHLAQAWRHMGIGHTYATVSDRLTAICLAYWKLHRAEKFTFACRA